MAIMDRLKGIINGGEPEKQLATGYTDKGKPKTFAFARGALPQYFEERDDTTREQIERWQKYYRRGGIITTAVSAIPELMFQNIEEDDWKLRGGTDETKQFVEEEIFSKFDMLDASWQQVINSLVAGSGIAECVRTQSDRFHSIAPRNPAYFDIETNNNEIVMYKQQVSRFRKPNRIQPERIWHLTLNPVADSVWGLSMIGWSEDEIIRDVKTAEGIAKGIERHGTPKWDIILDTSDGEPSDKDIENTSAKFKNINARTEFVHSDNITIEEKDRTGIQNIAEYSQTSLDRLSAATGIPEELLGLGRGSTEATANVRVQMFEKKIRSYQKRFNLSLWHQVLKPELDYKEMDTSKPIFIDFGTVLTDAIQEKAEAISKLMPQADPFLLLTRDEIRDELRFDEYPRDEEENPDVSDLVSGAGNENGNE